MKLPCPKIAYFGTVTGARLWRDAHGGRIFVPDPGRHPHADVVWFDLSFTPTPILMHPATRGLNGDLI